MAQKILKKVILGLFVLHSCSAISQFNALHQMRNEKQGFNERFEFGGSSEVPDEAPHRSSGIITEHVITFSPDINDGLIDTFWHEFSTFFIEAGYC